MNNALSLYSQFFLQTLIIIFFILLFCGIEWLVYRKFYPRLQRTKNIWDDILLHAMHWPLQVLIILVGLSFVFDLQPLANVLVNSPVKTMHFREFVVAVTIVWFLLRYIKYFESKLITHARPARADRGTIMSICKLLRVAVAFLACLFILQIVGIPISGLLAFGGAGAIIAGLAAKDLLANYFGGLMIYTDRPFIVGDWIRSPEHDIEGTVERIGWRLTRIRRFDRTPMYVPNALFSAIPLENPSRMLNRRMKTIIGLRYVDLDKLTEIIAEVEEMFKAHPEVDQSQANYLRFSEFSASALNLTLSVYIRSTETLQFMTAQQDILLALAEIIKKHEADFAFNTYTLDVPNIVKVDWQKH